MGWSLSIYLEGGFFLGPSQLQQACCSSFTILIRRIKITSYRSFRVVMFRSSLVSSAPFAAFRARAIARSELARDLPRKCGTTAQHLSNKLEARSKNQTSISIMAIFIRLLANLYRYLLHGKKLCLNPSQDEQGIFAKCN